MGPITHDFALMQHFHRVQRLAVLLLDQIDFPEATLADQPEDDEAVGADLLDVLLL